MKHACKRVSQLTSDSFERELSLSEKLQLKVHLTMCGLCRNYHQSLQTFQGVFSHIRQHGLNEEAHLPPEAKERIQEALKNE